MKKAQLLGQPFVMILALVVGALVLVWGSYQVVKLGEFGSDVQLTNALSDLRKVSERYYYYDKGSSTTSSLNFPSKVESVCFFNSSLPWNPSMSDLNKDFIMQHSGYTMFVLPHDAFKKTFFKVEYLKQKNKNPLCFKNGQAITLTSKGTYVEIS